MFDTFIHLVTPHLHSLAFFFAFLAGFIEGLPIVGVFIPGATIIIALSVYAKISHIGIFPIFIFATLGAFLGDLIGYVIGKWKGSAFLDTYGKWVFFTGEKRKRAEEMLHTHPIKLIMIGRFNSLTRAMAPFLFGASNFNFTRFSSLAFLSSFVWASVIVFGGYIFGKTIEVALHYVSVFFVVAALVAVALVFMYRLIAKHHHVFRRYHLYTLVANILSLFLFAITLDGLFNRDWFGIIDGFVYSHVTYQSTFLTAFFTGITTLADPVNATIISLVCFVTLISERSWKHATLFFISLFGSITLGIFLKAVTGVNRPDNSLIDIYSLSFPSNHTLFATVLALTVGWIYLRRLTKERQIIMALGLALFVVLVGASRIYLRVHWTSDVVAGVALGVFVVTSAILVMQILPLFVENFRKLLKK